MADYTSPPPTDIAESCLEAYETLKSADLAVLVGRNNSGKSFLLRKLARDLGDGSTYLGPARYHNFTTLSPYSPQTNRKMEKWRRLSKQLRNETQNIDNSPLDLQQAIAELTDNERNVLFSTLDRMLQTRTRICHTISDNSMSQKYIDVDDYNISFTSSGFRLVAALLTSLLDTDYDRFLIDEPELGLSPETQGLFADLLLDKTERTALLPHLKSLVIATHSPVFVDRYTVSNNYHIDRDGSDVTIRQLLSVQDIADVQFRLLGNRFETLYLPSAIVLVEGSTDFAYLERLLALKVPELTVSVIQCNSDGRMCEVLNIARQMLTDLNKSPYAGRIFAVIDSVHGSTLVEKLEAMGLPVENVVVWDANGIEYLYPQNLLEGVFGAFEGLKISGDIVSANGIKKKKSGLSAIICSQLTEKTAIPTELDTKLFSLIRSLIP